MPKRRLVISCEHGGHRIPPVCVPLFAAKRDVLQSHRGWDAGAALLAERLGEAFGVTPCIQTTSRLVVDNNRSVRHRGLFSEFTRALPRADRERLLDRHYTPHRARVEADVAAARRSGAVLHLAVHSFTPVLGGVVREADIGLLYDPRRKTERDIVGLWRPALARALPEMRVRLNYPYKGVSDGLPTALRKQFGARYAGIELEINQKHLGTPAWQKIEHAVIDTLSPWISAAAE